MGTRSAAFLHPEQNEITDRRLLRGARTRQAVLRHAVDLASLEGLEGVTFSRLAAAAGISKAGVQTLFRSKETLQLMAIEYAREMFIEAVVRPARTMPRGAARLRTLLRYWMVYAETPLFAGGCYRAANLADYDSRPGPIRDALFRHQQEWHEVIAGELRHAVDTGEIADLDIDLAVFQIDAVLCAANTALRMHDDDVMNKVHRVVESFLVPAT